MMDEIDEIDEGEVIKIVVFERSNTLKSKKPQGFDF